MNSNSIGKEEEGREIAFKGFVHGAFCTWTGRRLNAFQPPGRACIFIIAKKILKSFLSDLCISM